MTGASILPRLALNMATLTSTFGQRAGSVLSVEHNENGVSSRRLKKREIDRKCQRQARERTKTRIAYLEGLVEDFRQQDSSGQMATLMKQLKEMESERDVMAKTIKDIQKAVDTHKPIKPITEEESEDRKDVHIARVAYDTAMTERNSSSISPPLDGISPVLRPESVEMPERTSATRNFDLTIFSPTPTLPLQSQDQLFAPEVVPIQSDGIQQVQTKSSEEPNPMPCNWSNNWAAPRRTCSCNSCHEPRPGRRSAWQGNYWVSSPVRQKTIPSYTSSFLLFRHYR